MKKKFKKFVLIALPVLFLALLFLYMSPAQIISQEILTAPVERKSFAVDVRTIGELEASKSTSIMSSVRGDQGKIIHLVSDGVNVNKGEPLVKMDPTPFEEKIEAIGYKIKEHQSHIVALEKNLEWEVSQAERDYKGAIFDIEAAELELSKVLHGDGPLEISRLKASMQKALGKYEEFVGYSDDLIALEKEGFLNPVEVKHAQKRLEEEREAYESAKLQYESYVNHVNPMHIKKAEASIKQVKIKMEDNVKVHEHAIGKAKIELQQAQNLLNDTFRQLREAERELTLTEISAPSAGMVVHKEDYRNGQRRKPRIGDVLVRNQVIMDLPDLNFMTVKSKVREVDLYKIGIGKKASIEVDAYPHLLFSGTVTSIGVLALPDPMRPSEEKYFEIRVSLDESDSRIRPGMTTRIIIHADQLEDALAIPLHAVFYEQKKTFCYLSDLNGYTKREVDIGMQSDEWAEIKSGLDEGEHVCLTMPRDK